MKSICGQICEGGNLFALVQAICGHFEKALRGVWIYVSPTFDLTFPPVYIGRFFNFIRGISPQRRNEMGVGSKLRDKSDLVSKRRHYIQTLPPPYVLLYQHTSKKGEFWITQKYNISEIKNGQMFVKFQIFYEEKLQMCKKALKTISWKQKMQKKEALHILAVGSCFYLCLRHLIADFISTCFDFYVANTGN